MKNLIITEGRDDQKFFIGLLSYLKIHGVDVIAIREKARGSKSDIFTTSQIQADVTSETQELAAKILITCDADFSKTGGLRDGFIKTKTAFQDLLKELENNEYYKKNKTFGFFIIPNNEDDGNLETLYLNCLATDKSSLDCADKYLNCLSEKISLEKSPKMRALSLLTPIGLSDDVYRVGFAAFDEKNKKYREGYWDFESPALKPLSDFLKNYFN